MNRGLPTLLGTVLALFVATPVLAEGSAWDKSLETLGVKPTVTVYRSPTCGCCGAWLDHLRKHDFHVVDIQTTDMGSIKQRYGVPAQLASCHTAEVDGYVIEGHVPADDIKRLLKSRPTVAGLSVPQMPAGSPGMEMGGRKDPFTVVQFQKNGKFDAFREYWTY